MIAPRFVEVMALLPVADAARVDSDAWDTAAPEGMARVFWEVPADMAGSFRHWPRVCKARGIPRDAVASIRNLSA